MDRAEAESIYRQGEEAVVRTLLALDAQFAALKERIIELSKNSTNSNQSPSKDDPEVRRYPKKPASQKKQGTQPGHAGKNREMQPSCKVDYTQHHYPERCQNCQRILSETDKRPSTKPLERHQVWDIPPIKLPMSHIFFLHTGRGNRRLRLPPSAWSNATQKQPLSAAG